jgi:type VI protein secretion system component VasK
VAPLPIDTFNRLRLRVDGQDLESGQTAGNPQQIQWPNQSSGVVLDGAVGGGAGRLTVLTYPPGPWAVFRFFSEATLVPESGSGVYEWRPQTSGQPMMVNGRPVVFRYRLDHGANPPILKKGYLSTLSCPSTVTR